MSQGRVQNGRRATSSWPILYIRGVFVGVMRVQFDIKLMF